MGSNSRDEKQTLSILEYTFFVLIPLSDQFISKIGKNENFFSAVVCNIEFVFVVLVEKAHRLTQQPERAKQETVRGKEVNDRRNLIGHQDVAGLVKADPSRLLWRDGVRFFIVSCERCECDISRRVGHLLPQKLIQFLISFYIFLSPFLPSDETREELFN